MYQRSIQDSERQGRQLQMDYGQLMAQIEHLSEEVSCSFSALLGVF